MGRFDVGSPVGLSFSSLRDAAGNRPPSIFFRVDMEGAAMFADPPGATIVCETGDGGSSSVVIRSVAGEHIADVVVRVPKCATLTDETVAIASALYWSWWRACDMRGEAPVASKEADRG